MWELLPLVAVKEVVRVYTAGAAKYGANKWQGLPDGYQCYRAALLRHMTEIEEGRLIDPETGCLHAAQIAWNAIAMLHIQMIDNAGIIALKDGKWEYNNLKTENMTRKEISEILMDILVREGCRSELLEQLSCYDVLAEKLELDSIDTAQLLQDIEKRFGINLNNRETERFAKMQVTEIITKIKRHLEEENE
ncbi:MAG: dATP/dGTP diphosphohydrolase domain-containing protein [Parabacteroides sp.]